jgi:hypothetical protein
VGPGLYQPASWPIDEYPTQKSIRRATSMSVEDTAQILEGIFREVNQDTMPLSELVRRFIELTGAKEVTAYSNIRKSPVVILEPDKKHPRRKIVHINSTYRHNPESPKKSTIRKKVRDYVTDYLGKKPLHSVELNKLAKQATRELKCRKPTFYRYLAEMENVVKTRLESGETICTLIEKKPTAEFSDVVAIIDPKVRTEVERAVSLLNVDTVDFCLFHLGKIFDHTVREYINLADAAGVIAATRQDKRNLASRLDCLAREGVITNKATVDYLRHERNARAHELGERQEMMREAPELAKLYVKNIVYFQEKIEKLRD